jgi:LmbE family N-acetylglucosaminyl deacetylase
MMPPVVPRQPERDGYEILCLGAHGDDPDKREVEPDLVLAHYREDRHQDHRLVSELTTTPSATPRS